MQRGMAGHRFILGHSSQLYFQVMPRLHFGFKRDTRRGPNRVLHVANHALDIGRAGARIIDDVTRSIDLMPTILDIVDAKIPDAAQKQLRGISLVSIMKGESPARDVFSETDYRQYTYKRSVIAADGWKLICTLEANTRELFDLTADPGETRNLAAAEPARADALQEQLFDHFAALGHDLRARRWQIGLNPVYPSQGKPKR